MRQKVRHATVRQGWKDRAVVVGDFLVSRLIVYDVALVGSTVTDATNLPGADLAGLSLYNQWLRVASVESYYSYQWFRVIRSYQPMQG